MQPPPAAPGMAEHDVDTPALLVDLDALEFNLDRMAALLDGTGVRLRAHAKTHKSPLIAHMQAARGAIGQCVQKVAEAEIMAWGGVQDILVSNEVVRPAKLARLMALSGVARVAVCTDCDAGVDRIADAAAGAGVRQDVLVEIDTGHGRCGVAPGPDAVALAQRIAASPHLRFAGLQAYHGTAQHMRTLDERTVAIVAGAEATRRTVEQLRQRGLACDIAGGGVRRVHRNPGRQLRLHGRRLRPQSRGGQCRVPAVAVRSDDCDEYPSRPCRGGRRAQSGGDR